MDLAELLLRDWNIYMAQTWFAQHQEYQLRPRVPTVANVDLLRRLVTWCRDHKIEPRLWLFFLFKSRGWRYPPRFDDKSLQSEMLVTKYRKLQNGLGFFRRRMSASSNEQEDVYDQNRDLAATTEALKERFLNSDQSQRCMDETLIRTLGYHPLSNVCTKCKVQIECASRLESIVPFPILALRNGRITSAEAEHIANEASK